VGSIGTARIVGAHLSIRSGDRIAGIDSELALELLDPAQCFPGISDPVQTRLELDERAQALDGVEVDADVAPPPHVALLRDPRGTPEHRGQDRLETVGVGHRKAVEPRHSRARVVGSQIRDQMGPVERGTPELQPARGHREIPVDLHLGALSGGPDPRDESARRPQVGDPRLELQVLARPRRILWNRRLHVAEDRLSPRSGSPDAPGSRSAHPPMRRTSRAKWATAINRSLHSPEG
jgi:hypothetical protein